MSKKLPKEQKELLKLVGFTQGITFAMLLSAAFVYLYDSSNLIYTFPLVALSTAIASFLNIKRYKDKYE